MKFLNPDSSSSRTLADIIMEKLQEKQSGDNNVDSHTADSAPTVPQKVVDVYVSVGKLLQHYRSGKLPKALKMLPHLKNWEYVLWLTRPDLWSPAGTYAITRIFASNLNANMAQRFFNLVLLEKCREDIRNNNKLNYHLYLSLKKALFKPGAFYKGLLLPLIQSGTCTLRESIIIGSVLAKVSIPGIHSAAAILRISELPYYGSTSMFLKVLLQKKYALPQRVLDAVADHFSSFLEDTRTLPVVWHQSLLIFVQRYKNELSAQQIQTVFMLIRSHSHHEISSEIRRELTSQQK
jgi:essential nuclear protein 1